eukprot:CAMPEP_0179096402 /NCGR_PEP_ID=MMETSP0796-20121207/44316_1 /TAXON_ID=73915 /ORGANISM="Pyrodinium bahamense, Strain pbaha01" /LENGTH=394 /DNA_ID=CAMNT_0020794121 /DNA_START=99 /DNA_END=1284 /DNA_ORIENTATION=+
MEFPFRLASFLGAPPDCSGPYVGVIDEAKLRGDRGRDLCEVLDALGKASAAAQGLRKPVTTGTPLLMGQRIYLLAERCTALGFLKVGTKRLFVTPPPSGVAGERTSGVGDALREVTPLCALDFYVHESCQRHGYGRRIFDAMLRSEGLQPAQLAYDRPSPKLKAFLTKHFGLSRFRPQNNNYVIFDEYFDNRGRGLRASASGEGLPHRSGAPQVGPVRGYEARALQEASRPPPLPHQHCSDWAWEAADTSELALQGCVRAQPGSTPPRAARERGRTPRAASRSQGLGIVVEAPWGTDTTNPGTNHAGTAVRSYSRGMPASGCEGHASSIRPQMLAAGMPSAGSRGASRGPRSASVPLTAVQEAPAAGNSHHVHLQQAQTQELELRGAVLAVAAL